MGKRYLEIGKIVAVQGLKGEVRVQPWCDSPEFLCGFETLYFKKGEEAVAVERARTHKTLAVVKLKGFDTPEAAASLRGKILYMDRDDVELSDGQYFIQDLIGLEAIDIDSGVSYGVLEDVSETGANDIYCIKQGDKRYYIPAIPDVVKEVDIDGGTMKIRPLKGLFDDAD